MSRNHSSRLSAETSVIPGGRLLEIWRGQLRIYSPCATGSMRSAAMRRAGSRTLESSLLSLFVPRPAAIVCDVVGGVVVVAVAASWSVMEEGVCHDRGVQIDVVDERIPARWR